MPGKVDSQGWDLPLLLGASPLFPTGHWLTQDTSFWSPEASGQWTYRTVPLPQNVLWTGLEAQQITHPQAPANRTAVLSTEAHSYCELAS